MPALGFPANNGIIFSIISFLGLIMLKTKTSLFLGICIFIMLFQALPAFSETEKGPVTALVKTDTKVGNGAEAFSDAESKDVVVLHYIGWIYDADAQDHKGKQFNSTIDRGKPLTFKLGSGFPPGLDQGVVGMKVGGKRTLLIPPELAYGGMGKGVIPPNSALVLDVELLKVIVDEKE